MRPAKKPCPESAPAIAGMSTMQQFSISSLVAATSSYAPPNSLIVRTTSTWLSVCNPDPQRFLMPNMSCGETSGRTCITQGWLGALWSLKQWTDSNLDGLNVSNPWWGDWARKSTGDVHKAQTQIWWKNMFVGLVGQCYTKSILSHHQVSGTKPGSRRLESLIKIQLTTEPRKHTFHWGRAKRHGVA